MPAAKTPAKTYRVKMTVWLYPGENAAWHFVTLPKKVSDDIKKRQKGPRVGWGSVRVKVTVGKTAWSTSVFPDSRSGSYLLPIKADVRKREKLVKGSTAAFTIVI